MILDQARVDVVLDFALLLLHVLVADHVHALFVLVCLTH